MLVIHNLFLCQLKKIIIALSFPENIKFIDSHFIKLIKEFNKYYRSFVDHYFNKLLRIYNLNEVILSTKLSIFN